MEITNLKDHVVTSTDTPEQKPKKHVPNRKMRRQIQKARHQNIFTKKYANESSRGEAFRELHGLNKAA